MARPVASERKIGSFVLCYPLGDFAPAPQEAPDIRASLMSKGIRMQRIELIIAVVTAIVVLSVEAQAQTKRRF